MAWLYTFSGYGREMRVPLSFASSFRRQGGLRAEARGSGCGSPEFGDFWHVITKIMLF